jgi:site-specific recombinase XerD
MRFSIMLRTRSGLPRHCYSQVDRHGKRRVRFRARGVSIYLTGTPWSEEFMRQHAIAMDLTHGSSGRAARAGTIDALVASYIELVFPALAASTRDTRRNVLTRFCHDHGDKPVAQIARQHVNAILAHKAAQTPHASNNLRKVLRHLFKHAVRLGWRDDNPVAETERIKVASRGWHTWTDAEIARYRAHWQFGTQQRLAFELALETTSRRADICLIGPQHERDGKLDLRHTKNDSDAFIPIMPELRAAIDAMGPIKQLTFLHTQSGKPRSAKALGGDFRQWCDVAGLPKRCSLHGLRKGGARRLAEAGATPHEIMAITGHKTLSEVQRYTAAADQVRLAEQAIEKLRRGRKA